jgi:hypothetical protein
MHKQDNTSFAVRHDGWTPERKVRFLDRLAARGNVRLACRAAGMSPEAAYRLRRRDPLFARGWAAALVKAREVTEQVLAERAIDGVEEKVWYRGELIDTRLRFDARLLLAHMARLDRLADEETAGADADRFDELLACIAGEQPPETLASEDDVLPIERDSAGEEGARLADRASRDAEMDLRSGEEPPAFDPEAFDAFEDACEAAAERGRAEGERLWDRWFDDACGFVDRTCEWEGALPPAGCGGDAPPAPFRQTAPDEATRGERSFLRTPSMASTSALAHALASCAPVPHSPCPPLSKGRGSLAMIGGHRAASQAARPQSGSAKT